MKPTHCNSFGMRACKGLALLALAFVSNQPARAQIRALDYDTPTYIEMERSEFRVYEGDATVTINLFRTGEFRVITRVDWETIEQSASSGTDFKAAGGTLVFQPGEGFKSITLQLLGDNETEQDETFTLKLSASSETVIIPRETANIVVQDTPAPISANPTLRITPASAGQIKLSWNGHPTAKLERSTNPQSATWETVPCAVQSIDGECEVVEPAGAQLFFYRLRTE